MRTERRCAEAQKDLANLSDVVADVPRSPHSSRRPLEDTTVAGTMELAAVPRVLSARGSPAPYCRTARAGQHYPTGSSSTPASPA
jgi:hypothetical protein